MQHFRKLFTFRINLKKNNSLARSCLFLEEILSFQKRLSCQCLQKNRLFLKKATNLKLRLRQIEHHKRVAIVYIVKGCLTLDKQLLRLSKSQNFVIFFGMSLLALIKTIQRVHVLLFKCAYDRFFVHLQSSGLIYLICIFNQEKLFKSRASQLNKLEIK